MPAAAFIAGDWGTSRLRLSLCDTQGGVLESCDGPGIGPSQGRVEDVFFAQIAPWERHGNLPILLCGMAGSSIGWREAPYMPCPIGPQALAQGLVHFQARGRAIALTPGLSCRNALSAPDYMRGEETQILGALHIAPALRRGCQILCMPGTHTKWVALKEGIVTHFLTAVSGELYDVLHNHSVLVNSKAGKDVAGGRAFEQALEQTGSFPDGDLIHRLFQVRSRQLSGEMTPADAAAYLSGLIVGQDVAGAARLLHAEMAQTAQITIIGAPRLGDLYGAAFKARGGDAQPIDGDTAARAGLTALYQTMEHTRHDR